MNLTSIKTVGVSLCDNPNGTLVSEEPFSKPGLRAIERYLGDVFLSYINTFEALPGIGDIVMYLDDEDTEGAYAWPYIVESRLFMHDKEEGWRLSISVYPE